jgi:hypothetical protein
MLNITVHPGSAPLRVSPGRPTRAHCRNRGAPSARATVGTRSGCRPSVRARPHAPCVAWRPRCRTPPPLCCRSPPLKGIHRPPTDLFLPRAPFISSVHVQALHARPHCPGVHLTSFPPPKPLLRAGLYPSVTAVRPSTGERPSELLLPSIDRRLRTPGSPSNCRTQPPSSVTTGVTPSPLNIVAPTASRRPTIARSSR